MEEYKYLVLAGGGAKGLTYIGLLEYVEKHKKDFLKQLKEVIGCSIGAFAALLIVLEYNSELLKNIFKEYNLELLKGFKIGTFFNNFGLDNGRKIQKFIKIFIKSADLDENITLKEFYEKKQKKFITVVTNINTKTTEYISVDNHPDLPVYLAVQMSMCIPFIYQPVKYRGIYYVDGGLTCNLPVRYFSEKLNPEEYSQVLCFCFEENKKNEEINDFDDYLYNMLKSSFNTIEKIDKKFGLDKNFNIVTIPVDIYTNFNLHLSNEVKNNLYKAGFNAIEKFFHSKEVD